MKTTFMVFALALWGILRTLNADARAAENPWLDFNNGGIAVGHPQGGFFKGHLINGSLLPKEGLGFRRIGGEEINYGTGHMISLLEHASAAIQNIYPGTVMGIGGISLEGGGHFPPHKSHQNGLDADITFVGTGGFVKVVDPNGQVNAKFDLEKNWAFWRMITEQRYEESGKTQSIVSMILVAPAIKDHICKWVLATNALSDPLNMEVMRRIRPAAGHDTHFHLRLHCSPDHVDCDRSSASPAAALPQRMVCN